jgi:regulation of enolase protein 1 (concanavalin A-like superfamily)
MKRREDFTEPRLPADFYWHHEPHEYYVGSGLDIVTDGQTDFWQKTHYGFQRDDGHACLLNITGDFSLSTQVTFQPQSQYDQCGLMVRIDAHNWIKVATEYEDTAVSRLGSVVTNLGYSDWATQDISSEQRQMWYRLRKRGSDFLIEYAFDGELWRQMRIAHLSQVTNETAVGVYACSPIGQAFRCRFAWLEIAENDWFPEEGGP